MGSICFQFNSSKRVQIVSPTIRLDFTICYKIKLSVLSGVDFSHPLHIRRFSLIGKFMFPCSELKHIYIIITIIYIPCNLINLDKMKQVNTVHKYGVYFQVYTGKLL